MLDLKLCAFLEVYFEMLIVEGVTICIVKHLLTIGEAEMTPWK